MTLPESLKDTIQYEANILIFRMAYSRGAHLHFYLNPEVNLQNVSKSQLDDANLMYIDDLIDNMSRTSPYKEKLSKCVAESYFNGTIEVSRDKVNFKYLRIQDELKLCNVDDDFFKSEREALLSDLEIPDKSEPEFRISDLDIPDRDWISESDDETQKIGNYYPYPYDDSM